MFAEFRRRTEALERIAAALEAMLGTMQNRPVQSPPEPPVDLRKTTFADLGRVDISGERKTLEKLRRFGGPDQ